MKSNGGFTLIELMVVVVIIGVLASIAIPAYSDYVKRSRMSAVLSAMDAIAEGASEYHAVLSYFPSASYGSDNLAQFSETYADIDIVDGASNDEILVQAVFNANLDLTDLGAGSGQLTMRITFGIGSGYVKDWDLSQSTIDAIYMPKK
jgi:type IV pilus assembly protein PilA